MTGNKSLELILKYRTAPILHADFNKLTKPTRFYQLTGWRTNLDGIRVYEGYIKDRSAN